MREIKFRGWDGKKMVKVYSVHHNGVATTGDGGMIIPQSGMGAIMQDTGLKDRSGVEIYEGDIVTWGDVDGYIEMSGTRVAVVDMSVPEDGLTFDAFKPFKSRFKIGNFMYRRLTHKCMTVIGNIYEHGHLLVNN